MYIKDPIVKAVSDCCWKIWKNVGPGFEESYYKKALEIELANNNISCQREVYIPLSYNNVIIGKKYIDLLVDGWLIVEAKSTTCLIPAHFAQTNAYLKAFDQDYGILVNFGSCPLKLKLVYKNRGKS